MLAIRIPPHLNARIEDYAQRFGITKTDAAILALYRGFGDQRGIKLTGRRYRNADGSVSYVAPHRPQQPARSDPGEPLPDPFEDDD